MFSNQRFEKSALAAVVAAIVTTATMSVGGAGAETIRATTYLNDTSIQTVRGFGEFGPKISAATDGAIAFELFTNGVLVPARQGLVGIGSGVAQVGFHTTNYTPTDLPSVYSLSGMGFRNPDPYVLGFAFTDWLMNEPEGKADFAAHNIVPVGGVSTPSYELICRTDPITSVADLQGKKLRFPGGQALKLAPVLGFATVTIPAPDMYVALQNGQIDCAAIYLTFLYKDMNLHEVAKSVTLINLPPVFNDPIQLYNADYWQTLTPEQRRAIFDLAAEAVVDEAIDFRTATAEGVAYAKAQGIAVVEADEEVKADIQKWVDDGIGGMIDAAHELGVQDPDALFATFQSYMDKWDAIMKTIPDRNDRAALLAAVKTEIFDGLDAATYGVKGN